MKNQIGSSLLISIIPVIIILFFAGVGYFVYQNYFPAIEQAQQPTSTPPSTEISETKSDCNAEYGQLALEACDANCEVCVCANGNSKIYKKDNPNNWDLDRKAYICLLSLPGDIPSWHPSGGYKSTCSDGNLSGSCKCGNYACGFTGGTNYCEDDVCSIKNDCNILSNRQSSECDDENACTIDTCIQDLAQNKWTCKYQTIASCINGDGCCPSGCTTNNDSDCKLSKKCSDGTEQRKCSTTKPKICTINGITGEPMFLDDCKTCGCPSGLSCDIKGSLCYNASAQTQYIFTNSNLQLAGYDSSKFVNSSGPQNTSGGQVAVLYKQEAEYYKMAILHYQGNLASYVHNDNLNFYQVFFEATILKTNEYGDRSVRLEGVGADGVEGRILLIQKGNHTLDLVYLLADESKINTLIEIGLEKMQ